MSGGGGGLCPEQDIITLKKATSNNIQGLFQGFITLIINIEGKYGFFVHFWHQTFIGPGYFYFDSRYVCQ